MRVGLRKPINPVDQVADVTKTPRLVPVTEHGQRLALERLPDERRHHPPVPQPHPRTVSVEDPHDPRIDPVMTVVRHRHRLGKPLGFVVHPARTDRVHVAPVALRLRMDQRIAVDLGGRGEQESRLLVLGQPERVVGPERADLQGLDRQLEVINRAGGRGEMEHVIHRAGQENKVRDIMTDETEPFVAGQVRDVVRAAGHQVVQRYHLMSLSQQPVAEMRAQKPGSAGHHRGGRGACHKRDPIIAVSALLLSSPQPKPRGGHRLS